MNLGGVFYTSQSYKLHEINSSFTNSYLLKHGNIFTNANAKGFPINLKRECLVSEIPGESPVCNNDHSDVQASSPSHQKSTEDIQNATAGSGKCDTWILGNQKLSWDNSTVASYNPETKMFRCVVCNAVGFLSRIAEHYLGTHTSAKVFQCLHCPYSSTWSRCVRMHMAKHHGVPNAPPSLWKGQPLLEEIFHLLNTLKTAVDGQGKEKADVVDKKFACPKCPYTTDRRDLFLRHENIHNEEKPYHCYVCFRLFNRADHVKKHFLRIHRDHQYDISLVRRNLSKLPPSHNKTNASSHEGDQQTIIGSRSYPKEQTGKENNLKEYADQTKRLNANAECPMRTVQSCYAPKYNSNFPCSTCEYIRAKAELLFANVYTFGQKLICAKCKFIGSDPVQFENHIRRCCSDSSKFREETGRQSIMEQQIYGDQVSKKKTSHYPQTANDDSDGTLRTDIKGSIRIIPLHNSMSHCYSTQSSDDHAANGLKSFRAYIPDVQPCNKSTDATAQIVKETDDVTQPRNCRKTDEPIDEKSDDRFAENIVCWHCGCEFADQLSLQTHEELYHRSQSSNSHHQSDNRKKKNFVCVVCEFCSTKQTDMIEHMRCHAGLLLKCHAGKSCNYTTVYDSDLSKHVFKEHSDGITRCPHCGLPCLVTAAFIRHYKHSHHPYPCHICKQVQTCVNSERSSPSHSDFKHQLNPHNPQVPQSGVSQVSSPTYQDDLPTERNKRSRKQTTPRKVLHLKQIRTEATKKLFFKSRGINSNSLLNKYRRKHLKSHALPNFFCRACRDRIVMYKEKKNFHIHHLWIHSRKNIQCSKCEEKFCRWYQLLLHERKHHSK